MSSAPAVAVPSCPRILLLHGMESVSNSLPSLSLTPPGTTSATFPHLSSFILSLCCIRKCSLWIQSWGPGTEGRKEVLLLDLKPSSAFPWFPHSCFWLSYNSLFAITSIKESSSLWEVWVCIPHLAGALPMHPSWQFSRYHNSYWKPSTYQSFCRLYLESSIKTKGYIFMMALFMMATY